MQSVLPPRTALFDATVVPVIEKSGMADEAFLAGFTLPSGTLSLSVLQRDMPMPPRAEMPVTYRGTAYLIDTYEGDAADACWLINLKPAVGATGLPGTALRTLRRTMPRA